MPISNLTSHISNLKSHISNLKSHISNLTSQISHLNILDILLLHFTDHILTRPHGQGEDGPRGIFVSL